MGTLYTGGRSWTDDNEDEKEKEKEKKTGGTLVKTGERTAPEASTPMLDYYRRIEQADENAAARGTAVSAPQAPDMQEPAAPEPYVSYADFGQGLLARVNETSDRAARYDALLQNAPIAIMSQDRTLRRETAEAESVYNSGAWRGNPMVADLFTELSNRRNTTAEKLERMRQGYVSLQADAQKVFEENRRAVEDFNGFYGLSEGQTASDGFRVGSGEAWDRWRGSIREAGQIEPELREANRAVSALSQQTAREREDIEARAGDFAYLNGGVETPEFAARRQALAEKESELEDARRRAAALEDELYYSKFLKWEDLRGNADFAERSGYVPTSNGREAKRTLVDNGFGGFDVIYDETGFDDLQYEYINGNQTAKDMMAAKGSAPAELAFGDGDYLAHMSDEQRSMYNYVYATQGRERAEEYLSDIKPLLTEAMRETEEKSWREYASAHPVASSAFSVIASTTKGGSYIGQGLDLLRDGEIDQNAAYNRYSYINSAVRDEVSKKVEDNWGKVGSFLYQTGMSMGDFLLTTAVSGGQEALSLAIMGTGAAADTVIEAKDRGLSDGRAFVLGSIAGAAEILTEKVSLETLLDKTSMSRNALGYFLKNTLAEGSEEAASDLINWVADVMVAGDKSQWREAIEEYRAQGLTDKQAFVEALKDKALEIGVDALGGALSGGFMAAPGTVGSYVNANRSADTVRYWDEGTVRGLVDQGLGMGQGTAAYRTAAEVKDKLDAGREISRRDVGYLINTQEQTRAEEAERARKEARKEGAPQVPELPERPETPGAEGNTLETRAIPEGAGEVQQPVPVQQEAPVREAVTAEREAQKNTAPGSGTEEMSLAERRADLERREADASRRAQQFMDAQARGENVSGQEERLMAEADGLARERAEIEREEETRRRQAEDEAYRARMRELTVAPTGAEMEERRERASNLRELERSGRESGAAEEQIAVARRLADATGRRIVFLNEGQNGRRGSYRSGTVYVNAAYGNETGQIIAHELTHSIEETGDYAEFSGLVQRRILSTGGDLQGMLQEVRERYADNGVELDDDDALREVTAEFVERELLTSPEAVESLCTENRSLGRRILDLLDKILAKLGSDAAKERDFIRTARDLYARALVETRGSANTQAALDEARRALAAGEITDEEFDAAFDALGIGVEEEGGERHSIKRNTDNKPFVQIDRDILAEVPEADWVRTVKNNLKNKFPNGVAVGNSEIKIDAQSRKELTFSRYMQWLYYNDPNVRTDKLRSTDNADEILEAATDWKNEGLNHPRNDNIVDFSSGTVLLRVGANDYTARVVVGTRQNGQMLLYDILDLAPTSFTEKRGTDAAKSVNPSPGVARNTASVSTQNISQGGTNVKTQHSFARDGGDSGERTDGDIRETVPAKARGVMERSERGLVNAVGELMQVPRFAQREYLSEIARDISREYLKNGSVSQETRDRLFDTAFDQGVEVDREYYDRYKDLKKRLRETPVTVGDESRADVPGYASFKEFRSAAAHTLRLTKGEGTPVDVLYMELSDEYPELFPRELTDVGAQVGRMFEAADSIRITEHKLRELYPDSDYRKWARNDFEEAVTNAVSELRTVKRYAEDRAQQEQTAQALTLDEVKELYPKARDARKAYEKVNARNLLTAGDQRQVGRLLRGEIELSNLSPERDNVRGITAVFEAKREYEKYTAQIRAWNEERRAKLRQDADGYLTTANGWKDKRMGILYQRETMERNVRDIVPDGKLADRIVKEYFTPVHEATAKATRLKNTMRDRVRELKLSRKVTGKNVVSESHAVQLLGEAMDNIDYLSHAKTVRERDGKTLSDWRGIVRDLREKNPDMDWDKIQWAVGEFRKIYDELFEMMNDSRVRNGYEPVAYRRGYFPHFQPGEGDGVLSLFGKALGISTEVTALPTTINGLTHTFRPGIQWFGNALERLGVSTAYDAVEGFDKYIEGVADVIYQTENIQKLRALASQARYRTGDEGLRRQVDQVRADTNLSEIDKENRIRDIYEKGRYALSNFVVELEEYTNLLANKKSRADRNMEQALGRNMYNLVKTLEGRVAANMVAVNPGSWLTNFIPLTQGGAMLDWFTLLRGMWQTLRAYKTDDGIVDMSSFLTNRRGSDPLVRTWQQKASAKLSSPMEVIDNFTAGSLVRGRYQQNLSRGMSEAAAMEEADAWVAGVMADRSKGSTPTLFNRSSPLTKLFTQFQLEVNNQLSYVFKDMPRGFREKGAGALALALFKFALGAWLYDEVYEYFIGRRPALDPIGIINDTVGDLTGYEMPNLVSLGKGLVTGDVPSFETEKGGAASGLVSNIADQLPFMGVVGALGLDDTLGLDIDAGRLSVESAIPNVANIGKAITGEGGWAPKKRLRKLADELAKPLTYIVLPFGGGQMKKILQGVEAAVKGGSYTVDTEGRDILQYPVYTDTLGEKIGAYVGGAVFGKSSTSNAQKWVESGFKNYSALETGAYQGLTEAGIRGSDANALILALRAAGKTEDAAEKENKIGLLKASSIPEDIKIIPYYALVASDKEREVIDQMAESAPGGDLLDMIMEHAVADKMGDGKTQAKNKAVLCSKLTNEEKVRAMDILEDSDSNMSFKMQTALDYGIDMEDFYAALYDAVDIDGDGKVKQEDKVAAIDKMKVSKTEKAVLYQLVDSTWVPKNNPFDTAVGQRVYDAVQAEKTRRENGETESGTQEKRGARWEKGRLVLPKAGESGVLPRG